jgi:hypothetical protein
MSKPDPPGKPGSLVWGESVLSSKPEMRLWLTTHGGSYQRWLKLHPAAVQLVTASELRRAQARAAQRKHAAALAAAQHRRARARAAERKEQAARLAAAAQHRRAQARAAERKEEAARVAAATELKRAQARAAERKEAARQSAAAEQRRAQARAASRKDAATTTPAPAASASTSDGRRVAVAAETAGSTGWHVPLVAILGMSLLAVGAVFALAWRYVLAPALATDDLIDRSRVRELGVQIVLSVSIGAVIAWLLSSLAR